MKNYVRLAAIGAVLVVSGLLLAACGSDPGQMVGGGAPAAGGFGGGLLDLANKALPSILTTIGVPSGLAGAIPLVLNMLRNQKASNAQTVIATQNSAMDGLLNVLPLAVDAVRARADQKVDDGVNLLKTVFGDRIAMLGIDDGALRALIEAKLGPKPSASPPPSA